MLVYFYFAFKIAINCVVKSIGSSKLVVKESPNEDGRNCNYYFLHIKKQWSQSDTPIRYRTILIKSILEVLKILLRLLRLKVEGEKITSKNVLRP